jgi:hypothetical protein
MFSTFSSASSSSGRTRPRGRFETARGRIVSTVEYAIGRSKSAPQSACGLAGDQVAVGSVGAAERLSIRTDSAVLAVVAVAQVPVRLQDLLGALRAVDDLPTRACSSVVRSGIT